MKKRGAPMMPSSSSEKLGAGPVHDMRRVRAMRRWQCMHAGVCVQTHSFSTSLASP